MIKNMLSVNGFIQIIFKKFEIHQVSVSAFKGEKYINKSQNDNKQKKEKRVLKRIGQKEKSKY